MSELIGTATIKFSESEIQLLINSLHMSISTVVPCVDNGEWKVPYEVLRKDLKKIRKQQEDKKWEYKVNKYKVGTKDEEQEKIEPGVCD